MAISIAELCNIVADDWNRQIAEVRATLKPGESKTITLQFMDSLPVDYTVDYIEKPPS